MPRKRTPLDAEQVLAWADGHVAATGSWPNDRSGPVRACPGECWRNLDNALRYGLRGLMGGSSLARLLEQRRGVRNVRHLPPLTGELILRWAQEHHDAAGQWPNENSGPARTMPGEVWGNLDAALRRGRRGLPGREGAEPEGVSGAVAERERPEGAGAGEGEEWLDPARAGAARGQRD